ncbi:MAG: alpha/beta hydrolase [Bacteroidales bacterium]|nr:alpha/beta hydrolase [Bacteroidales bacterium]MCM1146787.1 alpha/beta hydrolase [Bacteroidales bacterium]MCM1205716.1 alpha/beta hydrolase [Bacillota bacterium]MCM1510754.1 alpha/beta hydrolase [Clostridium sp.]
MRLRLTACLLLLSCIVTVQAQTARRLSVPLSADGKSELTVYLPERPSPSGMAIVGCPGGGYSHLSVQNEGHDWAPFLNGHGIAYAVLTYRMPEGDRNVPLSDAYDAMRTMRDSAAVWHVTPSAVGIMGFSAGGHLASAVSTHAPQAVRPDFTVLFYPVISMNPAVSHKGSCTNFLGEDLEDEAVMKQWSSDLAVRSSPAPPAVVMLANDDRTVPPVTNGIAYYSAMCGAGNSCSLFVWPSGGHGFGFRKTFPFHEQMKAELLRWLDTAALPPADNR